MQKHPYAEILKAIADGQVIEFLTSSEKEWVRIPTEEALRLIYVGTDRPLRVKPRTISINGYDVPEPVREPLKDDQLYYYPVLSENIYYDTYHWYMDGDEQDMKLLNSGLIHLTAEAAELHAKSLLSFTKTKE